jgi:4-hydroxy-3-polyprenylbenzoate decarboxylase
MPIKRKFLVAVCGASGSIYAERLVVALLPLSSRIYLIFSDTGKQVSEFELSGLKDSVLKRALSKKLATDEQEIIRIFSNTDLFSPVASGSSSPDSMVIVPSSMGTIGRISMGVSSNLIERSADVILKQKKQLIVCPRESPLNLIHLRNMTQLAEAGAEILPLMPAFYHKPSSMDDLVNFCVGRILEQLNLDHDFYKPWNHRMT